MSNNTEIRDQKSEVGLTFAQRVYKRLSVVFGKTPEYWEKEIRLKGVARVRAERERFRDSVSLWLSVL